MFTATYKAATPCHHWHPLALSVYASHVRAHWERSWSQGLHPRATGVLLEGWSSTGRWGTWHCACGQDVAGARPENVRSYFRSRAEERARGRTPAHDACARLRHAPMRCSCPTCSILSYHPKTAPQVFTQGDSVCVGTALAALVGLGLFFFMGNEQWRGTRQCDEAVSISLRYNQLLKLPYRICVT